MHAGMLLLKIVSMIYPGPITYHLASSIETRHTHLYYFTFCTKAANPRCRLAAQSSHPLQSLRHCSHSPAAQWSGRDADWHKQSSWPSSREHSATPFGSVPAFAHPDWRCWQSPGSESLATPG